MARKFDHERHKLRDKAWKEPTHAVGSETPKPFPWIFTGTEYQWNPAWRKHQREQEIRDSKVKILAGVRREIIARGLGKNSIQLRIIMNRIRDAIRCEEHFDPVEKCMIRSFSFKPVACFPDLLKVLPFALSPSVAEKSVTLSKANKKKNQRQKVKLEVCPKCRLPVHPKAMQIHLQNCSALPAEKNESG